MRLTLSRPPWVSPELAVSTADGERLLDGTWSEAAQRYAADRAAKLAARKRPPIGVQPFLNRVIDERFEADGWFGGSGRFVKERVWLRITFRHQMSLGADVVDALKVIKKGIAEVAIIAAADHEFLRVVSPNDAAALTSYEKLRAEFLDLEGVIDVPLLLGRLTPRSDLPPATASIVFGPRPREG